MKKFILIIMLIMVLVPTIGFAEKNDKNKKNDIVYFYSGTCRACQNLKPFMDYLTEKYKHINIVKYSIIDIDNKALLNKYSDEYSVRSDFHSSVPIVFVYGTYLAGEEEIRTKLEDVIIKGSLENAKFINNKDASIEEDIKNFQGLKVFGVFTAGIVNGLNPCSLALLIFLLSLLISKNINTFKLGNAFILGKFIMFLFMGTVIYQLLSFIKMDLVNLIMKIFFIGFVSILIALSVNDYFASKKEKYNKIRLQLPNFLRKINHRIIKVVNKISNIYILLFITFVLGIVISLGEFFCTGQIYLTSIVTVLQSGILGSKQALFYLIVYDIGFILPLIVINYILHKSKNVFKMSEFIREKLPVIKLINIIILFIFVLIIIFRL